jgi:hypothetical protein
VPGIVMVSGPTSFAVNSAPGASYPSPTRPPAVLPAPRGRDLGPAPATPAAPGTALPVAVSVPAASAPPPSSDQVTAMVGDVLSHAPPPSALDVMAARLR